MSTQLKPLLGLIFTLLTCIPLATVAIGDLGHELGVVPQTQRTELEKRAASFAGREIEDGANLYAQYCVTCHGERGEGTPRVAPPLNRAYLLDGRRVKEIGWAGNTDAFLKNAIAAGRLIHARPDLYAIQMPPWSDEYRGPLRSDQINALIAFMLNWKDQAPEANAYPPAGTPRPMPTAGPTPTPTPTRISVNVRCQNMPAQYAGIKSPYKSDDKTALAAGKRVYDDKCAACHGSAGKGDGVAAARLNPKPPDLADKGFMQMMPVDCNFYLIAEGVKGTGMAPWKSLGEDTLWKVLVYVRAFAGVP